MADIITKKGEKERKMAKLEEKVKIKYEKLKTKN
jgi:hypothetical protein